MNKGQPHGYFKPIPSMCLWRLLIRVGLSRGIVTRWIKRCWERQGCEVQDVEIRGVKYRLHLRENTTDLKLLTTSKYYDREEIDALASVLNEEISKPSVFVDLGANTGYYSLELLRRGFERVIAIEPNPPTLNILRENLSFNKVGDRLVVAPYCVGAEGTVDFFTSEGLGSASVLEKNHEGHAPIQVQSKPLLQILSECGVDKIDALKIDVEGFEDRVLLPFFDSVAEKAWPRVIVIEHCNAEDWEVDLFERLKKLNYHQLTKTRGNTCLVRK